MASISAVVTVTAPDGTHHVIAQGVRRFRVIEYLGGFPFRLARIEEIEKTTGHEREWRSVIAAVRAELEKKAGSRLPASIRPPGQLSCTRSPRER